MTPSELLEEVKGRFVVLYHDAPEALDRLLRQAMAKFQDKAGVLLEVWSETPVIPLPAHFKSVATCCDAKRREAAFRVEAAEDGQPEIHVISRDKHEPPYCMVYFADLRSWPLDEALPQDCVPLLADYLEALIALPNTQRERHAYLLAGMSQSASELPSAQDLRMRIGEIEQAMEENKALIPPASHF